MVCFLHELCQYVSLNHTFDKRCICIYYTRMASFFHELKQCVQSYCSFEMRCNHIYHTWMAFFLHEAPPCLNQKFFFLNIGLIDECPNWNSNLDRPLKNQTNCFLTMTDFMKFISDIMKNNIDMMKKNPILAIFFWFYQIYFKFQ